MDFFVNVIKTIVLQVNTLDILIIVIIMMLSLHFIVIVIILLVIHQLMVI